jgi:hypothetical protein
MVNPVHVAANFAPEIGSPIKYSESVITDTPLSQSIINL